MELRGWRYTGRNLGPDFHRQIRIILDRLEDPAFLARCRARALATVQEKFEIHDMARKTYAVYETAMNRKSKE